MIRRFLDKKLIDEKVLEICNTRALTPEEHINYCEKHGLCDDDGQILLIESATTDHHNLINGKLNKYLELGEK